MSDFVILNGIVWWRPRLEQIAGLVQGSTEAHPLKGYSGLFFARAQLRGCPASLLPLERKGIQVSFAGADLRNVNFFGEEASLRSVNFSDAKLDGAIFGRHQAPVNLAGASLRGADLRGCNLLGCNLDGADLRGAKLSGANLDCASLSGALLTWADLEGASYDDLDLMGAIITD